MFEPFEERAKAKGFKRIAGVDEAGRGPLAGPVIAASVIFKDSLCPQNPLFFEINDSKKISSKKRELIYEYLTSSPDVEFAISRVDPDEIDNINILQASLKAMKMAVTQHSPPPDYLLIDGNQLFVDNIAKEAVVQGDARVLSIAAASIIAKVVRDRIMESYHQEYPQYGFLEHKGYPTKKHREAIERYGLSSIHRKSFRVKLLCQEV
jgi:ribonuclease HII